MYVIPMLIRQWNKKRKLSLVFSRIFLIFPLDFVRKLPEKIEFSNKFLDHLKFSALSVPQNDAYPLN